MAKFNVPGLVGKPNLNGITRWYWQPNASQKKAGWTQLALGKDQPAAISQALVRNQEVQSWREGGQIPPNIRRRPKTGTFGALIERYRKEEINGKKPNGKPKLRPKTISVYETSLKRLDAWAGKHPVAYITPARVRALRDQTARPVADGGLGHSAAFNLLATLRTVFTFAERVDIIAKNTNPATSFDLGKPAPRRNVWELDDDAAFDAAAYDLGRPSMAIARELGLYSAQREGDLIRFTEGQLQELEIFDIATRELLAGPDGKVLGWCLAQTKTSTDDMDVAMEIPLEPKILDRVQAALRTNRARDRAATPPRLLTHVIVDDKTGLPFKQRAFYDVFREVLEHAAERSGRPAMLELVWHDLRRTRVVRLRRRRMPKEMIATITGHSLRSIEEMLRVYGPVDPTITAAAIASTLEPRPAKDEAEKEKRA